jgi:hypothetical protein
VRRLEQEAARRLRELEREVALFATEPLLRELEERFGDRPEVLAYLADVKADILEHVADFRGGGEAAPPFLPGARPPDFARYRVNVLVDNGGAAGAPVVVERNPTYYNLVGRIEYRASFGTMVTDFREIKPGALHRANGGFLVLEALDVLRHPFAWEALKRALAGGEARIESLGEEPPCGRSRSPSRSRSSCSDRPPSTTSSTSSTRTSASCSRSRPTSRRSSTGRASTSATTPPSSAAGCARTACATSTGRPWRG